MDNVTGKHNWCQGDNCGIMGLAGGWHITCRSKADNIVGVCRILYQIVCRLLASWIMGQIRGVVTGGGAPARFKQGHLWSQIQTADFAQTVAFLVFNFYWLLLEGAFLSVQDCVLFHCNFCDLVNDPGHDHTLFHYHCHDTFKPKGHSNCLHSEDISCESIPIV